MLLSEKQVWKIEQPCAINEEEVDFLAANPCGEASDWYSSKFKVIKDRIRDYYFNLQNKTCAYCRLPISGGTDNIEIEHIVDKNNRLDFVFEPLNLVVSCHKCNFTKNTRKVLHSCPPEGIYPGDGSEFKIIHGHYDQYFEHIEFKQDSLYHAISDKGEFTIDKCGLTRLHLAEQREEIEMYQNDPVIEQVILLRKRGDVNEALDEVLENLKNL